jgi:hypothetical protein
LKAATTTILLVLLTSTIGCSGRERINDRSARKLPPRELNEIVAGINENALKLDRAMWCNSVHVVARLVDSKGKEHAYNFDGDLLYKKPRSLLMRMRHGMGTPVMQVGSNDEEYWAWIEPEMQQMWWGRHRNAGKPCVEKITVRPEQMVDVLGIGALPGPEDGLIGPIRAFGDQYDILYYATAESGGRQRFVRQYYVDRAAPYQVRLIAFLDEFGRKEMTAYLDDYKRSWNGGPMVAHNVSIFWEKGKFSVKMGSIVGKSAGEVSAAAFHRPTAAQVPPKIRGNIEQIDANCD